MPRPEQAACPAFGRTRAGAARETLGPASPSLTADAANSDSVPRAPRGARAPRRRRPPRGRRAPAKGRAAVAGLGVLFCLCSLASPVGGAPAEEAPRGASSALLLFRDGRRLKAWVREGRGHLRFGPRNSPAALRVPAGEVAQRFPCAPAPSLGPAVRDADRLAGAVDRASAAEGAGLLLAAFLDPRARPAARDVFFRRPQHRWVLRLVARAALDGQARADAANARSRLRYRHGTLHADRWPRLTLRYRRSRGTWRLLLPTGRKLAVPLEEVRAAQPSGAAPYDPPPAERQELARAFASAELLEQYLAGRPRGEANAALLAALASPAGREAALAFADEDALPWLRLLAAFAIEPESAEAAAAAFAARADPGSCEALGLRCLEAPREWRRRLGVRLLGAVAAGLSGAERGARLDEWSRGPGGVLLLCAFGEVARIEELLAGLDPARDPVEVERALRAVCDARLRVDPAPALAVLSSSRVPAALRRCAVGVLACGRDLRAVPSLIAALEAEEGRPRPDRRWRECLRGALAALLGGAEENAQGWAARWEALEPALAEAEEALADFRRAVTAGERRAAWERVARLPRPHRPAIGAALDALAVSRDPALAEAVFAWLDPLGPDPEVARCALGLFGGPLEGAALGALRRAFGRGDGLVRPAWREAIRACSFLPPFGDRLVPWPRERRWADPEAEAEATGAPPPAASVPLRPGPGRLRAHGARAPAPGDGAGLRPSFPVRGNGGAGRAATAAAAALGAESGGAGGHSWILLGAGLLLLAGCVAWQRRRGEAPRPAVVGLARPVRPSATARVLEAGRKITRSFAARRAETGESKRPSAWTVKLGRLRRGEGLKIYAEDEEHPL
ncbi:MAG: hypothetical protein D6731_24745 [Planctomycetota bacterium]|nr:MAG: hypothetical protein D6731_24745 [Planctomycetota bacterium]